MSIMLLGIFFTLSLLGIPLAISLGLSVAVTIVMFDLSLALIARLMYTSMNSYLLVAIPLFILAGAIMEKGGVSNRIFNAANAVVGRWRGGLGHVNIIASMIFGGISGSSIADVASLGLLEIKAMTEHDPFLAKTHWDVWQDGARGFGGACFPKDTAAFDADSNSQLIHLARVLNEQYQKGEI